MFKLFLTLSVCLLALQSEAKISSKTSPIKTCNTIVNDKEIEKGCTDGLEDGDQPIRTATCISMKIEELTPSKLGTDFHILQVERKFRSMVGPSIYFTCNPVSEVGQGLIIIDDKIKDEINFIQQELEKANKGN